MNETWLRETRIGVLRLKGDPKTVGSMGNCIKPYDPVLDSIPRNSFNIDTTPIRESGLPIIFVIGGPGVGKRTLCTKVAKKYDFLEIISSEIIRQEVIKRTERAFVLAHMMSEGHLVPTDILIELITKKILNNLDAKGVIVSGFPRHKSQCQVFDREVRPPDLVLFLKARNSVLSDRINARSITTTERPVINFGFIKTELKKFHRRNRPIVKYYKELLVVIDGEYEAITVYENVCKVIDDLLTNFPKTSSEEPETVNNDLLTNSPKTSFEKPVIEEEQT
ncbi:adenylate kinase isoenzyme 1 [Colletes latitarsis]|uniref:adenylate kinase isoenzyme 1 n=1 Tax=Colletes latitarsis TaxID=2605962 RepID=UPI0040355967